MNNKLVFIISNEVDISTNMVIDWLNYIGCSFIRVNNTDTVKILNLKIDSANIDFSLKFNNKTFNFSDINSYWYRRGSLELESNFFDKSKDNLTIQKIKGKINNFLKDEIETVATYIHLQLQNKKNINYINDNYTNKIDNIYIANKHGLYTPDTLITSKKSDVISFFKKHQNIISKGISRSVEFEYNNKLYINMTELFDNKKEIENLPDNFFPTMFQEKINKKYELRIFFFDNTFYSSAVFSQQNKKTSIDCKLEGIDSPNRVVPYNLPKGIKVKLQNLLNQLNINSGSIDMAVTPNGNYVFFEVNPIGQFAHVSFNCNYHIHKKIANYLSA